MIHFSTTKKDCCLVTGLGVKVLASDFRQLACVTVLDRLVKNATGIGAKLELVKLLAAGRHRSKQSLSFCFETDLGAGIVIRPVHPDKEILGH